MTIKNTAFVFIKPHANNANTQQLAQTDWAQLAFVQRCLGTHTDSTSIMSEPQVKRVPH
jgi:hypothetical protein